MSVLEALRILWLASGIPGPLGLCTCPAWLSHRLRVKRGLHHAMRCPRYGRAT